MCRNIFKERHWWKYWPFEDGITHIHDPTLYENRYVKLGPIFHEAEFQRGDGLKKKRFISRGGSLGDVFGSLAKLAVPLLTNGAKAIEKQALSSAIAEGKTTK